jgi:hypothetical protein
LETLNFFIGKAEEAKNERSADRSLSNRRSSIRKLSPENELKVSHDLKYFSTKPVEPFHLQKINEVHETNDSAHYPGINNFSQLNEVTHKQPSKRRETYDFGVRSTKNKN